MRALLTLWEWPAEDLKLARTGPRERHANIRGDMGGITQYQVP